MRTEYTSDEAKAHEDLLRDLKSFIPLSIHIKNNLDTGNYPILTDAIDIVISPDMDNSLMGYLIYRQRYEDCAWLLDAYNKLIVKC